MSGHLTNALSVMYVKEEDEAADKIVRPPFHLPSSGGVISPASENVSILTSNRAIREQDTHGPPVVGVTTSGVKALAALSGHSGLVRP